MTPAERGAALLDEKKPGWYREIDTERLDLAITPDCVIGQLYGGEWGSYSKGILDLDITEQVGDLGFDASDDLVLPDDMEFDWDALTNEWRELIYQRLQAEN